MVDEQGFILWIFVCKTHMTMGIVEVASLFKLDLNCMLFSNAMLSNSAKIIIKSWDVS